jgi:hypothetical protein
MFSGTSFDPIAKLTESFNSFAEKIGKSLVSNLDAVEIAKTVLEVDDAAVGIAKSFGQGRENVLEMSKAMAGAVREVTLLGGGFESIAKIQKDVGEGLGRNLILTTESYEKLFAAQEVSGESAKTIVTSFKDAGFSAYQSATQMEKVVNVARSMGVNAQAVSGVVLENMNALNKFNFSGGVEGLAKMASQASMLRINMRETLNFAEKVFDPEGAIEVAAAMQRLGVANSELLDPLRLMDMAQNDPTELQNQLSKMTEQFVQLNEKGQFEIMPGAKRQLREISQSLNIPYDTLTKMAIGTKELDMKMQQMDFSKYNFTEEQRTMIANMAEMGDDGQFKISIKGESLNLDEAMTQIAGMGEKERAKFFEATKEKTVEELAKDQLDQLTSINSNIKSLKVIPYAVAGTSAAKQALEAPRLITEEVSNLLTGTEATKISSLTKGIDEASSRILDDINKLITGEGSMTQLLNTMTDVGKQFESFSMKGAEQMTVQYEESIKKLGGANNIYLDILLNSGKKIKDLFLKNENLSSGVESQTMEVQDFIIKPLPQDSIKIVGGTNLDGNNNQQMVNTNNTPIDINLKMDINAPPNIDTSQLVLALQNTGVREAIITAVNRARTNDNQTTTTPNPQRQMVMTNNAMGLTGIPNV